MRHRWALLSLLWILALAAFHSVRAPASPTGDTPRFDVTRLAPPEAAEHAAKLLGFPVSLDVAPDHPVRRTSISLFMAVSDPNDLLNGLAAAYGLRWIRGPKPGQVSLVDKREYRGTVAGLRQAAADALPAEVRDAMLDDSLRNVERPLKEMKEKMEERLEAATREGLTPLERLDPVLAQPLLYSLNSITVHFAAAKCNRCMREVTSFNPQAQFHYGMDEAGARQFLFRSDGRWESVPVKKGRDQTAPAPYRVLTAPGGASPASRFELTNAALRQAAAAAARLLKMPVVLGIERGHPAYRVRITLSMSVTEPNDLLNALANAYGLRWVNGPKSGEISLISKRHYVATSAGLRQAVADAFPDELREPLIAPRDDRLEKVKEPLKHLTERELKRLEAVTANGPVLLSHLDPELAAPLLQHLNRRSVFVLGAVCDRMVENLRVNSTALFHYGKNEFGTKQFSFRIGNRGVSCFPE